MTIALTGNPNQTLSYTNKNNLFLFLMVGSKFGYGVHYNKWIAVGVHSGLNWEWSKKLVVAPFCKFKIKSQNMTSRITLQAGLGKLLLGRGNLLGDYKKISLGFQIL
jgi:hypothetical protein